MYKMSIVSKLDSFPDKPWYWLGRNPSITMKDVLPNSDKLWNWYKLGLNPSITMKDVLAYPNKPKYSSIKDVLAYPDEPCDWNCLNQNSKQSI